MYICISRRSAFCSLSIYIFFKTMCNALKQVDMSCHTAIQKRCIQVFATIYCCVLIGWGSSRTTTSSIWSCSNEWQRGSFAAAIDREEGRGDLDVSIQKTLMPEVILDVVRAQMWDWTCMAENLQLHVMQKVLQASGVTRSEVMQVQAKEYDKDIVKIREDLLQQSQSMEQQDEHSWLIKSLRFGPGPGQSKPRSFCFEMLTSSSWWFNMFDPRQASRSFLILSDPCGNNLRQHETIWICETSLRFKPQICSHLSQLCFFPGSISSDNSGLRPRFRRSNVCGIKRNSYRNCNKASCVKLRRWWRRAICQFLSTSVNWVNWQTWQTWANDLLQL